MNCIWMNDKEWLSLCKRSLQYVSIALLFKSKNVNGRPPA